MYAWAIMSKKTTSANFELMVLLFALFFLTVRGTCYGKKPTAESGSPAGRLCFSNGYSFEPLFDNDVVPHHAHNSGLSSFIFCHVMWEAMCRVEICERERAFVLARAKLIPAPLLLGFV